MSVVPVGVTGPCFADPGCGGVAHCSDGDSDDDITCQHAHCSPERGGEADDRGARWLVFFNARRSTVSLIVPGECSYETGAWLSG